MFSTEEILFIRCGEEEMGKLPRQLYASIRAQNFGINNYSCFEYEPTRDISWTTLASLMEYKVTSFKWWLLLIPIHQDAIDQQQDGVGINVASFLVKEISAEHVF